MMKGYKKIFWGMFLSIFHVNLRYIRILPPFIAYLIIASGCNELNEKIPKATYFHKANRYAKLFAILSVLGIMGSSILQGKDKILIWYNLCNIVQLIMSYNIFQGSIQIFQIFNHDEYIKQYKMEFNILIIYYVSAVVMRNLNMILNNKILNVVVIATLLIWHICFLFLILRLGKMNLYEIKS